MTRLLLVIVISLGISFLCSILEAVLLSITHSYVAVLKTHGRRAGTLLGRMRENIDEPIAAILTLNTIAHTIGAALSGAIALQVFGSRWVAAFSAVLTLAILVFSEILPKTIGATYWQTLAPYAAQVLRVLIVVLKPVLIPLAWFNRLIRPRRAQAPTVSRAEIEVLAELGRREGSIDEEEWQIVTNVINLDRVRVAEVMTPRTRMIAVPVEAGVEGAKAAILEHGHMRLPVYEGAVDDVVGIVLGRDLWRAIEQGETDLREVMRAPLFVPATKPVEDLIRELRVAQINMVIVVDEFGGTAGIATMEDLIEEIVGEIRDEHETPAEPFEEVRPGEYRLAGTLALREAGERLGITLPEETYDTVGGFVFGELGRLPMVGDEVTIDGGAFRVSAVQDRGVARVTFRAAPRPPAGDASAGE
jgi:CBS domain containing-hemolysin-like protein